MDGTFGRQFHSQGISLLLAILIALVFLNSMNFGYQILVRGGIQKVDIFMQKIQNSWKRLWPWVHSSLAHEITVNSLLPEYFLGFVMSILKIIGIRIWQKNHLSPWQQTHWSWKRTILESKICWGLWCRCRTCLARCRSRYVRSLALRAKSSVGRGTYGLVEPGEVKWDKIPSFHINSILKFNKIRMVKLKVWKLE